jgi:acetoin utilization deacetylase AcuC-like enzyme
MNLSYDDLLDWGAPMNLVGLVYDPVYLLHNTGIHCENSDRLANTLNILEETGIKSRLRFISPRQATVDELVLVHAREYISSVETICSRGGGNLDSDTVLSHASYQAAITAVGGTITATEHVLENKVQSAFSLVRPPGHHATCWRGMGFCVFNNIAIAAKYAVAKYNLNKVLIVDFDVHHGNGTQEAFYTDPSVFYFSTHQFPLYPGTGNIDEIGLRSGHATNMNIPMVAGWGDNEYQAIYEDILAPVAARVKPDLIMVSAGYDAHWADTLASMRMSVDGYTRLAQILTVLAKQLCNSKIVFVLEGGYDLKAMPLSVATTLNVMLEGKGLEDTIGLKESLHADDFHKFLQMIKEKYEL